MGSSTNPADSIIAYFMLALIPICIIIGITNLTFFGQFYRWRLTYFVQTRKPALIILYCIISSISALLTLPYMCFIHTLCIQHDSHSESALHWMNTYIPSTPRSAMIESAWIVDFVHELNTCFLVIIIAIRCWCLYFDYQYAIASAERVWRKQINAEDANFWLVSKAYLGNYKFILYLIAALSLLTLCVFITLHLTNGTKLYGFMADFVVALPVSMFILWLYSQIHRAEDRFMVKQELKRLSLCVFIIIFSFITWIVKYFWMDTALDSYGAYNADTADIHAITYTADIIFIFFTVYFQTKWVIQRTIEHREGKRSGLNRHQSTSTTATASSKNKEFRMVDVMRSKAGFRAFIKHCVKELNVEGLVKCIQSTFMSMFGNSDCCTFRVS